MCLAGKLPNDLFLLRTERWHFLFVEDWNGSNFYTSEGGGTCTIRLRWGKRWGPTYYLRDGQEQHVGSDLDWLHWMERPDSKVKPVKGKRTPNFGCFSGISAFSQLGWQVPRPPFLCFEDCEWVSSVVHEWNWKTGKVVHCWHKHLPSVLDFFILVASTCRL